MGSIFDKPGGDADILNRKDYLKDQKLIKNYGEDAMKSRGFLRRDGPDAQKGGLYRNLSEEEMQQKRGVTKKAKGGFVRAFNNGGAVMSGRGPKFKGSK